MSIIKNVEVEIFNNNPLAQVIVTIETHDKEIGIG